MARIALRSFSEGGPKAMESFAILIRIPRAPVLVRRPKAMADGVRSPSSAVGSYGGWTVLLRRVEKGGEASLFL